MAQVSLASTVERAIEERAGVAVIVEESAGTLVLSGRVDSAEARQAAEDVAREVAPGKRIDNDLEVEQVLPVSVSDFNADEPAAGDLPETVAEATRDGGEIDPDFTDQRLSTSGLENSTAATVDPELAPDGEVFFPPTDPVVTTDARGNVEVLGGFTPTSTSSIGVAPSASDNVPGDEALADAIRRELREDALTTDLAIEVTVRQGVAFLRGTVPDLEDAENAEEVAGRVPGISEVVEELRVASL